MGNCASPASKQTPQPADEAPPRPVSKRVTFVGAESPAEKKSQDSEGVKVDNPNDDYLRANNSNDRLKEFEKADYDYDNAPCAPTNAVKQFINKDDLVYLMLVHGPNLVITRRDVEQMLKITNKDAFNTIIKEAADSGHLKMEDDGVNFQIAQFGKTLEEAKKRFELPSSATVEDVLFHILCLLAKNFVVDTVTDGINLVLQFIESFVAISAGHLLQMFLRQLGDDFFERFKDANISTSHTNFEASPGSLTPLALAVQNSDKFLLELMLKYYSESLIALMAKTTQNDGMTPLHLAALKGLPEIARLLFDRYPSANEIRDNSGKLPVHYAAMSQNFETLNFLAERNSAGCLIMDDAGNTPLHYACVQGSSSNVKLLCQQAGASCLLRNKDGNTPIQELPDGSDEMRTFLAIQALKNCSTKEDVEVVRSSFKDDDKWKQVLSFKDVLHETILHYLVRQGQVNVVKEATRGHADVLSIGDNDEATPLHPSVHLSEPGNNDQPIWGFSDQSMRRGGFMRNLNYRVNSDNGRFMAA